MKNVLLETNFNKILAAKSDLSDDFPQLSLVRISLSGTYVVSVQWYGYVAD